jgi:imidazolonepropionase-like amidohydrolase
VCCSFAVLAAEPATVAPTRIALHAARLLDVDSGRVLHDPLVAEGDRITNVSEGGSVPAGVQVIDRVGSLAPGHYADMIALAGDPLSDVSVLEHVGFVMKGGQVVRGPVLP